MVLRLQLGLRRVEPLRQRALLVRLGRRRLGGAPRLRKSGVGLVPLPDRRVPEHSHRRDLLQGDLQAGFELGFRDLRLEEPALQLAHLGLEGGHLVLLNADTLEPPDDVGLAVLQVGLLEADGGRGLVEVLLELRQLRLVLLALLQQLRKPHPQVLVLGLLLLDLVQELRLLQLQDLVPLLQVEDLVPAGLQQGLLLLQAGPQRPVLHRRLAEAGLGAVHGAERGVATLVELVDLLGERRDLALLQRKLARQRVHDTLELGARSGLGGELGAALRRKLLLLRDDLLPPRVGALRQRAHPQRDRGRVGEVEALVVQLLAVDDLQGGHGAPRRGRRGVEELEVIQHVNEVGLGGGAALEGEQAAPLQRQPARPPLRPPPAQAGQQPAGLGPHLDLRVRHERDLARVEPHQSLVLSRVRRQRQALAQRPQAPVGRGRRRRGGVGGWKRRRGGALVQVGLEVGELPVDEDR